MAMSLFGCRLVLALCLAALPLASLAETVLPTGNTLHARVSPSATIAQGGLFVATVEVPEALPKGAKIRFAGKAMPLYWFTSDETGAVVYRSVFGINVDQAAKAYPLEVMLPDGHVVKTDATVTVQAKAYGRQNISVSKSTGGLQPIPGEMEAIQKLKDALSPVKHWQEQGFVSPTIDCQNSSFGVRRYHNGKYTGNYHKGVDLKSPAKRPIRATAGGIVQIGTTAYRLHGGTVGIDHGQGLSSIYIHMSKVLVRPGEAVKAGQVIGEVGSTGFATGPHLHWGLYAAGQPVDPNLWVPFKRCQ